MLQLGDMCFEEGKVHVLVGPNGSGKSTLLNILAGLERADWGRVVYGKDKQDFQQVKHRITLVMQQPYLFNTTVFENIAAGLRYRRVKEKDVKERVQESARRVNLEGFLYRNASTLSGGERQRVALARAIVLVPSLLLLDEATANLDPESIEIIEGVLQDFREETGATIILVTHNIFQARRLADRVYLLIGGKLVEEGDRERFFKAPESSITRKFIGGEIIY